jgi:hypothetical protein
MVTEAVSSPNVPDDARRPRSIVLRHAVVADAPPAALFRLLATNHTARYRTLARGHECFDVRGGGPLCQGAIVDCRERAGNQEVHHVYRVTSFVPDREIAMESIGSRGFVCAGGRTYEAESNTFVRQVIEPLGAGHSRLCVSITIQFASVARKLLALASGTRRLWDAHLREETANLAALAGGSTVSPFHPRVALNERS